MTSFDQQNRREDILVRGKIGKYPVSGVIKLDARNTIAILETKSMIPSAKYSEAFFDVDLISIKYGRIILRQCIVLSATYRHRKASSTYELFPNQVLIGSHVLKRKGYVGSICFRLQGLNAFFSPPFIEKYYTDAGEGPIHSALNQLRKSDGIAQEDQFCDSEDLNGVLFIHTPSELGFELPQYNIIVRFQVANNFLNLRSQIFQCEPYIEINFPQDVSITDAIDAVYAIQRFFNQLAFQHLPITAIWMSDDKCKFGDSASLYLPTLVDENNKVRPQSVHVPFGRWVDRFKLMTLFRNWVSIENDRSTYRRFVDSVFVSLAGVSSADDIVSLCAAIDSFPIQSISPFDVETINSMARAAFEISQLSDVGCSAATEMRIRELLGQLNRFSLSDKIDELMSNDLILVDEKKASYFKKLIRSYRQFAAHGSISRVKKLQNADGKMMLAIHALAALCVLKDLSDSGLALTDIDGGIGLAAKREFDLALMYIDYKP